MQHTHQQLQITEHYNISIPYLLISFTKLFEGKPFIRRFTSYSALNDLRDFQYPPDRKIGSSLTVKLNEQTLVYPIDISRENHSHPHYLFSFGLSQELRQLCDPPAVLYTKGNQFC